MDVSGITDNGCVSERGSCDQVSNEDDEEISSNVVSSQPVRVSPKPWMPFTQLLVVLSRKVSEKDFKLVNRYYGLYKYKIISRGVFVYKLRIIVGDTLLRSILLGL